MDFMNFHDLYYDELLVWPFLARAVCTARGPASASEEAVTSDSLPFTAFLSLSGGLGGLAGVEPVAPQ